MKRVFSIIIMLCIMLNSSSAFAMNEERFANEPGNKVDSAGYISFGEQDLEDNERTNIMLMFYSIQEDNELNITIPLMSIFFFNRKFKPTQAKINTDTKEYNITFYDIGVEQVSGCGGIFVTPSTIEMLRDIQSSKFIDFVLLNDNTEKTFELTETQTQQLSLIVEEYDEEIAQYWDEYGDNIYYRGLDIFSCEVTTMNRDHVKLEIGSKGVAVKELQTYLTALGYLDGAVDGIYGKGTAGGVEKFQEEQNLEVTGIADLDTQALLYAMDLPQE